MRRKPQAVAAGGAGAAAGKTQRFRCGSVDVVLPIGAVQQLPLPGQAAVVLCICAALAGSVWACVTLLLPGLELVAAPAMRLVRMAWPLWGGAYAAIGVLHFTCAEDFRAIVPPWGAWGVWWIPGSAAFHVAWSGVAELLAGLGLLAGSAPYVRAAAPSLAPLCAATLCLHTAAVGFANIYMFTHKAPTPFFKGTVLPPSTHALRFCLQVYLLTVMWELAHARC